MVHNAIPHFHHEHTSEADHDLITANHHHHDHSHEEHSHKSESHSHDHDHDNIFMELLVHGHCHAPHAAQFELIELKDQKRQKTNQQQTEFKTWYYVDGEHTTAHTIGQQKIISEQNALYQQLNRINNSPLRGPPQLV